MFYDFYAAIHMLQTGTEEDAVVHKAHKSGLKTNFVQIVVSNLIPANNSVKICSKNITKVLHP